MYKNIFPIITENDAGLPFYITSIGFDENQEDIDRPDGYPSYHWFCCTSGKGILEIGGNEYIIAENTGFIFTPGLAHKYNSLKSDWKTIWITFDGYAVQRLAKQLIMGGRFTLFSVSDMPKLVKLFHELLAAADPANSENSTGTRTASTLAEGTLWHRNNVCSYLLYKFLVEMGSCISSSEERLKSEKLFQLEPVLIYMKNNFNINCSLEAYADIINITPQHLCRLFSQALNIRPFEYLTGIRLQKAKELLTGRSDMKLGEIALQSGFNDTSYFCVVFKKHEGITPMEFRKLHRAC